MYQTTTFGVQRLSDGAMIPADRDNADYCVYLEWVADGNVPQEGTIPVPVSPVDPKLVGVEFEGVMCSATKEDMWGLSAVALWVQAGNSTTFEFSNGNTLVLTPDNYQEFVQVWGSFRASFFPVM